MLLENEGEILAMTETVTGTYEGISPVIVDNDNSTISLDISALSAQLSGFDTFSGVSADSTLTGDGKTSALGVNMIMLTGMLDNAKHEAVASAQSGLIRDITYEMQNVGIFGDSMSGYNADGTVWIRNHWTVERADCSGDGLTSNLDTTYNTNYISLNTSAKEALNCVVTNSATWNNASAGNIEVNTVVENNSATWNEVTNKLDITSFSTVSGDFYPYSNPSGFITGVDLSNYYTKNETSGADELANAFNNIPAGDEEVNNTVHTYSGDWNSTYTTVHNNSASWAQGGSFTGVTTDATLTGDGLNSPLGVADTQTMSSNESISITTAVNGVILGVNSSWFDNAVNSAVTGTQGDAEVNAAVHNNSATWNTVTNKLDTTSFSTVSGTFLTAHQDLSNYVTETDLESTSATITAMIPSTAGLATETDLQIVSGGVDYISGVALTSVDLTPYLTTAVYAADSGTFATTSMLNDYQTTAGMTAYASTGDISGTQWNSVYETVETNSGSWGAGLTYSGIAPIVVNNTTQQISANTWQLSAGTNITLVDDAENNITRIDAVGGGYTPTYHYIEI